MTQQVKGSASTYFWFLAVTSCLLLWCTATNAQKATKREPVNEAERIDRALDGLKGADGSSIRAVADLGTFYLNSRRYAEAEALYRGAIGRLGFTSEDYLELFSPPFWTSPRRRSGRMTFITEEAYPKLIKALVEQKKYEAALELADHNRSRSLEVVIEKRLREENPAVSTLPMDVQRIRSLAKDQNATFVVYSIISQTEVVAWIIEPKGAVHFVPLALRTPSTQPDLKTGNSIVGQLTSTFSRSLRRGAADIAIKGTPTVDTTPASEEREAALRALYDELVGPLEQHLPNDPDAKVVVVPEGDIYLVPFNALMDNRKNYLIQRHTISIAPSLKIHELLATGRKSIRSPAPGEAIRAAAALVIGNPKMPSLPRAQNGAEQILMELPGAEEEARAIADLLHVQPITGTHAQEDLVMGAMPTARIMHFATHGLLVQASVLTFSFVSGSISTDLPPGAVVLAPNQRAEPQDAKARSPGSDSPIANGFLASGKIIQLRLDADLVTLSACDTVRGRTSQAEFVGLPSAFLAAGTRSVVMTLWSIPDAPTAGLMTTFYKEMMAGHSKVAALRSAILSTKESSPDPSDWAAFTLIGLPD
jgi:CHAT domain-containing protein